ncbi:SID1 transmembrane family member 1-like isoform X2 [Anticarsia gemmatalis]|uniref:SID1 transmembrane family member 1-like isoform X2 n=1 Tax=Anticarsia gemmatalis TaxID=129554 RepID=UPI003F76E145
MLSFIIVALSLSPVLCTYQNNSLTKRNFIYNTYEYNTRIKVFVNSTTEHIMEFYEKSEEWKGHPTRVHVSTNDSLGVDNPLFVTATQQKGVSSWELPLLVQTHKWALLFNDMERTLCPHDAGPDNKTESRPLIHITTSNPLNVSVDIKLERVVHFFVDVNHELELNVTPSSPKYYFFSFDQSWNVSREASHLRRFNYTIPKSVILMIDSDDEVCATVSIQNNSCPVFDNEKDALYKGYHLTMTTKGGITLTQSMFPSGFYIVFIVKESDDECTGNVQQSAYNQNRLKNFRFRVIATISYKEYVLGALITLAVVMACAALVLAAALLPTSCACTEEVVIIEEEPIVPASPSYTGASGSGERSGERSGQATADYTARTIDDSDVDDDNNDNIRYEPSSSGEPSRATVSKTLDGSIADEADEQWSYSHPLTVHKLTRAPPETLARRSDRYFWGALTVAVVYALPVVQLLFTYQMMVFQTGDQDLCYYNFLCAHPLGFLSDFNHVYSNIGYVVLGGVFMAQVRRRQRNSWRQPKDMGIPQHFGLLYSMGLGLIMEGLLSASYHLCPNKMNFQFDSSFMYVIAVLVMIKLYQNRHSDIIPSAHTTFMAIAVVMTLGLFGILFPSVYFSVLFTILHLLTCFVLTLKIYYTGKIKMEWSALQRGVQNVRTGGVAALRPAHPLRAVLIALANVANWSFAIYCAYANNKDFARQLLAILMGNAILYTMFYIVMKLVHRERIAPYTWLYFVLAHVAWFTALNMFLSSNTKWSQTPAQSRRHNGACTSLQLFDSHDEWHVTSAAAMFLSFNMLLTVDDPNVNTRRKLLHTF